MGSRRNPWVHFKTPDGRVHTFPRVFFSQVKRMLENYWVPEHYANVPPTQWPEGMARGRVSEVTI